MGRKKRGTKHVRIKKKTGGGCTESEDKKRVLKRKDGTQRRRGKVRVEPAGVPPLLGVNVPHLSWGCWNRVSLSQQLLPFIFCQCKWTAHRFPYD